MTSLEKKHAILAAQPEKKPPEDAGYSLMQTETLDIRSTVAQVLEPSEVLELEFLFRKLSQVNLQDKSGRRDFVDLSVQARTVMGKARAKMGKSTPDFSARMMESLESNQSLAPLFQAGEKGKPLIDVRQLTPKIISSLRHLTKDISLDIYDGLTHEYDRTQKMSRMKIDLGNDEAVIAYAPFDIDPQQKKKERKEFSTADVRTFLSQTQAQGSWVLLVGHSEHKLNQEFIAVPHVEKLIGVGGRRFLLSVNTFINAVLNANKGVVPGREKLSARIMKVPPEAGDQHLSGLQVVGDFPMVYLSQLGQQLVLKVDKTNHDQFDRVRRTLSE